MDKAFRPATGFPTVAIIAAFLVCGLTARPVRAQNEETKASPAATSSPAPTAKDDLIAVAKSAGNFTTFFEGR